MVWIEFLKKHKNTLLMGFCVSTFLLSVTLLILANVDLLMLMGLIILLTPPGFSFALVGILLLGTLIGALLWTGLNDLMDYIQQRKASLTMPLIEEDQQTTWSSELSILSEDNTRNRDIIVTRHDDNQTDTFLSSEAELSAFSRKAKSLLAKLSAPVFNQKAIEELSSDFSAFKEAYHQLSRQYHPDKVAPDKVVWSTQQFQKLSAIYSQVRMQVDRKLEHLSQKSEDELLGEENQLLKELIRLLKGHLKWLKQAGEELKSIKVRMDNLDKEIAKSDEGLRQLDEGIAQNEEGIRFLDEGIAQNDKLLKKNAERIDGIDVKINQTKNDLASLRSFLKDVNQADKATVLSDAVDVKTVSSSPVPPADREKSTDKTTSLLFFN